MSVGSCEKGDFECGDERPYIVELSNGTKFLCFFYKFGDSPEDEILSAYGEEANICAGGESAKKVATNINKLNP